MREAIASLEIASINHWLSDPTFATVVRTSQLTAFVWWQGGRDDRMPQDEYATKLRALIGIARAGHTELPVRIIELADIPRFGSVRAAQREVAKDPGVLMIPTADLARDDDVHFSLSSLQVVKQRIEQSLAR